MSFLTPALALAGMVAMAVPILIHLLSRRRRKPIEWAAMRFLLEAFRRHRRRLQLEQIILLAIRCLILALFGFALARPLLDQAGLLDTGGSRIVYIVLDNGLVSGLTEEDEETALNRHVSGAKDIIGTLNVGDRVGLVTAARPARGLIVPPSSDHHAIVELMESLEPAEAPTDLAGALTVVRAAITETDPDAGETLVYLLSDFRAGSAPLERPLPKVLAGLDRPVSLFAWPVADEPVANTQITAIEPVRGVLVEGSSDGSGQLTVRLARHGGALGPAVSQVRLSGPDVALVDPKVVQWEPGQSRAAVDFMIDVAVRGDRQIALTAEIDHDRLTADNARHLVLDLRSQVRTILIDRRAFGFQPSLERLSAGQWVRRALDPADEGRIDIISVEPAALGPADLQAVEVAILARPDLLADEGWTLLGSFVDRGGLLIVLPPGEATVHRWVEHLADDLDLPWRIGLEVVQHDPPMALATEQPASEMLRLLSSELDRMCRPVQVARRLPIDPEQTSADRLLLLADGSPLVIAGSARLHPAGDDAGDAPAHPSAGLTVLLAAAPELSWTNLPSQVLMVPLFQEITRQGLSLIRAGQTLQVGQMASLGTAGLSSAGRLLGPEEQSIGVDPSGRSQQALDDAGLWTVQDQVAQPIGMLAVNIDPAAGRTAAQSQASVMDWLGGPGTWTLLDPRDPGAAVRSVRASSSLAGLLLAAVLALVALETLLARWFSHARQGGPAKVDRSLRPSIDEMASLAPGGGR